MNRTLWVEVGSHYVTFRQGPKPPDQPGGLYFSMLLSPPGISRHEFARWSGLKLRPGCYGLRVTFAVIEKLRKVTEVVVRKEKREKLVRS